MGLEARNQLNTQLAVIGGGPAGLSAAVTVAELGARCILFEHHDRLGGQFVAVHSNHSNSSLFNYELKKIKYYEERLAALDIQVITNTHLWQVDTDRHLYYFDGQTFTRVNFEKMVVASGAYERSMPFKGWTLPGVITAGAAQRMIAQDGVAPGRRVLVAGRGPLMLKCAAQLVQAGVKVVAVVEATPLSWLLKNGIKRLNNFGLKLGQAFDYQRCLLKAHVPILYGHAVIEATGQGAVENATTVALDNNGHPLQQDQRTWDVDVICVSNGLEPDNHICRLLGCQMVYDPLTETFFPHHDHHMQTSLEWLFVAGETGGLGGASKALVEGQIAGLQAAVSLGIVKEANIASRFAGLNKHYQKVLKQAQAVDLAYVQSSTLYNIAQPDTIICRCEEVSLDTLRKAILSGNGSLRDLKNQTRSCMGLCQGRLCESILHHEVALLSGKTSDPQDLLRVRPPLEPVPSGMLIDEN
jgi:thioredoxin reductase